MATPHLFGAVYAIILNEKGEILLNQRQNTGYYDGFWTLTSGHIEPGESSCDALIREVKEESDLDVTAENIEVLRVHHRLASDREYMDVCYLVKKYTGTSKLMEPRVCSKIGWFAPDDLPVDIPPENRDFIASYIAGEGGFIDFDCR